MIVLAVTIERLTVPKERLTVTMERPKAGREEHKATLRLIRLPTTAVTAYLLLLFFK